MKKIKIHVLLSCAAIVAISQASLAQQPQGNLQRPPLEQAEPQAAAAPLPDAYRLNMMIRSSVIALDQANKTGNYTVLQDLAAPSFRAANDSRRLAQIFSRLRQRNLDLSPILFYTPKLIQPPRIAPDGLLRLTGYFPTVPERVNFDLYFQLVGDEWKIFGIGVEMSPADITASVAANQQGNAAPATNNTTESTQSASFESADKNVQAGAGNAGNRAIVQTVARAPLPERRSGNSPEAAANGDDDETQTAVENRTTNNATRIDLSKTDWISPEKAENAGAGKTPAEDKSLWNSFNFFSRD